ncbi:hypothetical protein ALT785_150069 [Alteromonas infernus]
MQLVVNYNQEVLICNLEGADLILCIGANSGELSQRKRQ